MSTGSEKFLALTPNQPEAALNGFAALCVRSFEPFRAPLTEADLERRRRSGLTPRQDLYVTEWGYPYVFRRIPLSHDLVQQAGG
ncbi:DUF1045 domain-containing protein [Roseibium salinum]|nr:DUF1045 domain-containing protein [Roseibium salinum]